MQEMQELQELNNPLQDDSGPSKYQKGKSQAAEDNMEVCMPSTTLMFVSAMKGNQLYKHVPDLKSCVGLF